MIAARAAVLALSLLAAAPAGAVKPDEILPDATMEARAREISAGLRCLVCRNESIDDSNSDFARTMRLLVRERLTAGDSDVQAVDYIVARYGEYVLLSPRLTLGNALIWGAGPLLLVLGAGLAWRFLKAREAAGARMAGPAPLTDEEQGRLARILDR